MNYLWQESGWPDFTYDTVKIPAETLYQYSQDIGRLLWYYHDCSPRTALRDLNDLVEKGVSAKLPGLGRNTRYGLNNITQ